MGKFDRRLRQGAAPAFGRVFLLLGLLEACATKKPSPPVGRPVSCFEVKARDNSPSTQAVFAARHCQGGGVTWAGILRALVRRWGHVKPLPGPSAGFTGDVNTLNGGTRFSIDDEGDTALFCADDPGLVTSLRQETARLNGAASHLRGALAEGSALDMECLDANGGLPPMPIYRPVPPPEKLAAVERTEKRRLQLALQRPTLWCFPRGDIFHETGALRFWPDGRTTETAADGTELRRGTWRWPSESAGGIDTHIEIELDPARNGGAGIRFHLDVGASEGLGFDYLAPPGGKVGREDLIPGDDCWRAR